MASGNLKKWATDRILTTPDGEIDFSANKRPVTDYDPAELHMVSLDGQIVTDQAKGLGLYDSGIKVPLQGRLVPAPEHQKIPGKEGDVVLQIAKGYRRAFVAKRRGIKYIPAIVYVDMPDPEFHLLVSDHGGEKGLGEYGLFRTMVDLKEQGVDYNDIVTQVRPTLQDLYPLSDSAKAKLAACKTEEEKLTFLHKNPWRGRFQKMEQISGSPFLLRDAWFNTLAGGSPRLLDVHLADGYKAHLEDIGDVKLGTFNPDVTRSNPGAKFMEFWENLQAELKLAAEEGRAPKSDRNMSNKEVNEMLKETESPLIREIIFRIQRRDGYDGKWYQKFKKMVAEFEAAAGVDLLNKILALRPPITKPIDPTVTPTQVVEQKSDSAPVKEEADAEAKA